MSNATVARRYAGALLQEAQSRNLIAQIDRDIELVRESLAGSRELVVFFRSPVVSPERKHAVIDRLFADRVDALTLRLMRLLVSKHREDLMPEVAEAYRRLRDEQLGVVEAYVRTAAEMTEEQQAEMRDALSRATGHRIRLRTSVEPGLVGGVIVRIGDQVFDRSVRNQLAALREQWERSTYARN